MQGRENLGCICTHFIISPASLLFFPNTCSSLLKQLFSKSTAKWATANVQLILQHCCKTSWIAMLRILAPTFEPAWHVQHHYSTCFAGTSQNNLPVFCHWVYCTLRLTRPSENPTPVPAQLYCFLKIFCTILTWQFEVTHSTGVGDRKGWKSKSIQKSIIRAKTFHHQKQLDL